MLDVVELQGFNQRKAFQGFKGVRACDVVACWEFAYSKACNLVYFLMHYSPAAQLHNETVTIGHLFSAVSGSIEHPCAIYL